MDTIKKIANAILDAGEGCQSGLVYVDPVEAAKAAIAVLLTDAEPVAYRVRMAGGVWQLRHVIHEFDKWYIVEPLYAAPPAASVAVKALQWHDRHDIPLRANDLLAESVVGQYAIRPSSTGKRFRLWMPGMDYNNAGVHFTVESAKADAQKHYEARIRSALSAQVQEVAGLDTRMKAAGMYTVAEMMGVTPLTRWKTNPAINTIEAFSEWLDRKVSEYLNMKAGYDLGDKREDDDLFEWVLAHAGVFSTIRDQFQVVNANPASKQDAAGQDDTHLEEIVDGAWGDNPATRGRARDELARRRAAAPAAKLGGKP